MIQAGVYWGGDKALFVISDLLFWLRNLHSCRLPITWSYKWYFQMIDIICIMTGNWGSSGVFERDSRNLWIFHIHEVLLNPYKCSGLTVYLYMDEYFACATIWKGLKNKELKLGACGKLCLALVLISLTSTLEPQKGPEPTSPGHRTSMTTLLTVNFHQVSIKLPTQVERIG